jgi:hypothetical protein
VSPYPPDSDDGLPAAQAPDLVDALIGYRQWRLHDEALWSPFADYEWARGVNVAGCGRTPGHGDPAPAHDCACGLHAWYRPCPRLGYATPDLVGGAVAMWGAVELHPTGMRAQYATIVTLVLPLAHSRKRRRLVAVADALEVDAVSARHLTKAAHRHGLPVPAELAPNTA